MKNPDILDFAGDGYIELDDCTGVISRCAFSAEDVEELFVYHLFHPNPRSVYRWALEKVLFDMPELDNEYSCCDDIPNEALVYFAQEPEFDYLTFDEDDMDVTLTWSPDITIGELLEMKEDNP